VPFDAGSRVEYDPTVRAFGSEIVRFVLRRTEGGQGLGPAEAPQELQWTGAFAFAADGRPPDCTCPEFCELDHANE